MEEKRDKSHMCGKCGLGCHFISKGGWVRLPYTKAIGLVPYSIFYSYYPTGADYDVSHQIRFFKQNIIQGFTFHCCKSINMQ
jgi:hypothetical protein